MARPKTSPPETVGDNKEKSKLYEIVLTHGRRKLVLASGVPFDKVVDGEYKIGPDEAEIREFMRVKRYTVEPTGATTGPSIRVTDGITGDIVGLFNDVEAAQQTAAYYNRKERAEQKAREAK